LSGTGIAGLPVKAVGLEVFPEADGYVVYQAARDKVHFLNHTAAFVLELCDGLHSSVEIGAIFRETFPPAEDPESAVHDLLARFVEEELIRIDLPPATASSTT
jgi:hypothetical protein